MIFVSQDIVIYCRSGSGPDLTLHGKLRFTTHALTATQTLSATQSTLGFIAGKTALIGATAIVADFNGTLFSSLTIDTAKNSTASVALSAAIIKGDTRIQTHDTFGLAATISTQNITFQGALTILGGIGATTVKINQTEITKTLTIALKDGTNSFLIEQENLPGSSRFHSDVKLTGGIDVDTFTLGGTGNDHIEFLATVIANGKAGTDVLTEGQATTHPTGLTTLQVHIP